MGRVKKKLEAVFIQQIQLDILMISSAIRIKDDVKYMYCTHIEIDAKYQPFIEKWGRGLYGWDDNFGFVYSNIDDSKEMLEHNLRMMKAKLESFRFYFNGEETSKNLPSKVTNIYSNQNNFYFEQVSQYIENNYSEPDKNEILSKISEINNILKSSDTKEVKWNKLSKIGKWVFDKSVDVGMQLLPLLLGIK